ncbi:hypothetical protein K502DRAFT_7968 [Neoconidiobolus thromboides FSU 785]|nr:hypothetical protein K502DRAFT_7968 [Neoconidiobolus thromboides FSU 785]
MMKLPFTRIINLLCFILIIIVNALGFFLPLGNRYFYDQIDSALAPHYWSIVIWALIYFTMFLFIVYQLTPFTYIYDYINYGISPLFWVQTLANVGWVFSYAYAPPELAWIQLIFIYLLFLSLALMYSSVTKYIKRDLATRENSDHHYFFNFFFGRFWLSVYFGWVSVSVIYYSFAILADLSEYSYRNASIVFGALGLMALILLALNRDVVYGLTVVWAAIWIALNYSYTNQDNGSPQWPVFLSALIVGAIILLACIITFIINLFFSLGRSVHRRKHYADSATTGLREPVPVHVA